MSARLAAASVFAAFASACLTAAAGPSSAEDLPALVAEGARAERSDEDLLVLQLRLGERLLSDGLLAYLDPGGVLLPLGELMRRLEFPIAVDPAAGTAEGWSVDETQPFRLDLAAGEVVVGHRTSSLAGALVERHADDLYVAVDLLSRWFPVSFAVDLAALAIDLEPRQKLPLESRLERQRRWQRQRPSSPESFGGRRFAAREAPFRLLGWPSFEGRLDVAAERRSDGELEITSRHSLLARGDLLGMTADLFVGGTRGGATQDLLAESRLVLSRKDPQGRLLGFLKATEISLGDLAIPGDPLISEGRTGRGLQISNTPTFRTREFDRITLQGDALPGWELELYRNDHPIDFQTVGDGGRYEFRDVPLHFGRNVLKLVFHGPYGQRRETVERIFVGAELLPPGETAYRIGLYQQDVGLLRTAAGPSRPDEPSRGEVRLVADVERGLSRSLSLTAGLRSLTLAGDRHDYGRLGLRTSLLGAAGRLELVYGRGGGWAGEIGFQRRLGRFSLVAEHARLGDLVSEENPGADLLSRGKVRLDGQIRVPGIGSMPVSLSLRDERRRRGRQRQLRLTTGLLLHLGRLQLANRWHVGLAGSRLGLDGTLLASGRFEGLKLRANLSYRLHPEAEVSILDLSGSFRPRTQLGASFGIQHRLAQGVTSVSGGIDWQLAPLRLGVDLGYSTDGRFRAGAGVAFRLGRDPRSRRWRLDAGPRTGRSAVSARVFLDRNADGLFDAGDRPLAGVGFQIDGIRQDVRTDADGVAWLALAPYRPVDLEIDESTLEDPFWMPAIRGLAFVSRPGAGWTAEFPVVVTAEIDGTVYLRRGEARSEVSNVTVELVGNGGEVVQQVKSQFDGFYLFDRVRPGAYSLRIARQPLAGLGLVPPPAAEIVLASGEVRSGVDFVLTDPG